MKTEREHKSDLEPTDFISGTAYLGALNIEQERDQLEIERDKLLSDREELLNALEKVRNEIEAIISKHRKAN